MKDNCDKFGVIFEAIRMDSEYIKLRKGAARDRELETIVGNIRKASQAGVKIITYNWQVIPYRRNGKTSLGAEVLFRILSSLKRIGRVFQWEKQAE